MGFIKSRTLPQIWNGAKYAANYKLGRPSPLLSYRPVKLGVYITSWCNLKCAMCPYQDEENKYRPEPYNDMTFDTLKCLLGKFKSALVFGLTAEGEPFLNEEIFRMIDYASKVCKMDVYTSTNGVAIGDKIEKIINSRLSQLNVSLDAVTPERYRNVRRGNKKIYETVIGNIQRLVELKKKMNSKLKLRVSYICTKKNYNDIPEAIALAEDLGIDKLHLHNVTAFGTELSNPTLCLFDDPEIVEFIRDAPSSSKVDMRFPVLYSRNGPQKICGEPFTSVGFNSRGDINLCCMLGTNKKYGNAFEEKDVWNNSQFQDARRKFLNNSLPFKLCRFCPSVYNPMRKG